VIDSYSGHPHLSPLICHPHPHVIDSYSGCYPHRCLSSSQLQLRVGGIWRDCRAYNGSIVIPGWSGFLRCPPASELCASAANLGWPEIVSVTPAEGPSVGATLLTIQGWRLGNGTGTAVKICGVAAIRALPSNTSLAAAASPNGEDEPRSDEPRSGMQTLLAWTPALAPQRASYGERVSCHVSVHTSDGREALAMNAFAYVQPVGQGYALACKSALDFGAFEWQIPHVIGVYLCLWPYVLVGIVAFSLLRCTWSLRVRWRVLQRLKASRQARSGRAALREVQLASPL